MSTQVQILSGETMFLWELYPVAQFWSEDIFTEANYFENNKERMRYPKSRKQGLFVGSGVIEAGCKTLLAGSNRRECSGPPAAPMPLSPCAAVSSVANSKTTGSRAGQEAHFKVVRPEGRVLLTGEPVFCWIGERLA